MKNAQASLEYLFVILFFFGFLILIGGLLFTALSSGQTNLDDALAGQFSATLSESSSRVFFGGTGSKLTLEQVNFPTGVDELSVMETLGNHELIFRGTQQTFAFSLPVPLRLMILPDELSGGTKTIVLEALLDRGTTGNEQEPFVAASFGSACPPRSPDGDTLSRVTACSGAGKYATAQKPAEGYNNNWWSPMNCWQLDVNGDCMITSDECADDVCDVCSDDTDCPAVGGIDGYCSIQSCVLCSVDTPYRVAGSCVECRAGMSDCMSGSSCVSGVCQTLLALGAACSASSECASGLCDNTCKLGIGASCSADSQCLSGECESGTCDYRIVTFAGGGSSSGSAALMASLSIPHNVFVFGSEVFFPEFGAHRVRRANIDGDISTIAGNGTRGFSGDGDAATSAQLDRPTSVSVSVNGDVFITDRDNHLVRKLTPDGNGYTISTVAGTRTAGFSDGGMDNDAVMAQLRKPSGVFASENGDVFIADGGNHLVRKLTPDGNGYTISTVAGTAQTACSSSTDLCGDGESATMASLNTPQDVFVSGNGEVFIADTLNQRVRKLTPNMDGTAYTISTIAGTGTAGNTDGGTNNDAVMAQLRNPSGVSVSANGEVFIADRNNHLVRKLTPDGNGYTISTIAGGGSSLGDNGPATSARLNNPRSVSVNGSDIFIADLLNHRIRKLCANASNC